MEWIYLWIKFLIPFIIILKTYNWLSHRSEMNKIAKEIQERKERNKGGDSHFPDGDYRQFK